MEVPARRGLDCGIRGAGPQRRLLRCFGNGRRVRPRALSVLQAAIGRRTTGVMTRPPTRAATGAGIPSTFIAALILLVAAAAAALTGCERAQGQQAAGPGAAPPPPAVTVAQPILRELVDWDEYSGRLEASEQVEVRPRVTG